MKMTSPKVGKRTFSALEGARTLLNFWIVLLHCNRAISHCCGSSDTEKSVLLGYFNAPWRNVVNSFEFQVDAFFMISGYLLSLQLLQADASHRSRNATVSSRSSDTFIAVVNIFAKRYFRLVPGMICAAIFSIIISDIGTDSAWRLLLDVVAFRIDLRTAPMALLVIWSNWVEIIGSVVITCTVLLLRHHLLANNGYLICLVLFSVALTPRLLCLRLYPAFALANLAHQPNLHMIPSFNARRVSWLREHYVGTADTLPVGSINPFGLGRFLYFYSPWWARLGPFFIGLGLAIAMYRWQRPQIIPCKDSSSLAPPSAVTRSRGGQGRSQPENSNLTKAAENTETIKYEYSTSLHWVLSSLTVFAWLLPVLFSLIACFKLPVDPTATIPLDHPPPSFCFINVLTMIIARPLMTFGVAYMLYRCMLPSGHPLHLRMLNSLLSLSVLRPLAELSYTIYILHYRVILDVLFWLLPLGYLDSVLGPQRGVAHLLVVSAATYILTAGLAYVVYHGAEKHMQKAGARLIAAVQSYIGPSNDSSRKVSTGKAGRDKQS